MNHCNNFLTLSSPWSPPSPFSTLNPFSLLNRNQIVLYTHTHTRLKTFQWPLTPSMPKMETLYMTHKSLHYLHSPDPSSFIADLNPPCYLPVIVCNYYNFIFLCEVIYFPLPRILSGKRDFFFLIVLFTAISLWQGGASSF